MKKLLLTILLLTINYSLLTISSFAQEPTWTPACDPCGLCVEVPTPPPDYNQCIACLAQEGKTWTVIGCIPTSAGGFVQIILEVAVKMIGGIAFLALLYGGFLLLTSGGDVQKITKGKAIVASVILGVVLVIFSVFILKQVGVVILQIPGFGP